MARTKAQKKEIIGQLETIMNGAQSLVFVNVHGLKVSESTAMRRGLRADKVGFFVAKKTLASIALAHKKYAGTAPEMPGEFGLAYGVDLVAPARGVYEFQKKYKNQVAIVGGVFEGKFMTKEEMTAIAAIPPVKTLQGMFVNVINSPIQGLVVALDKIAQKKA